MAKTAPILIMFALALALAGCTQGGIPPACANATSGSLANCVYLSSVLEQNPYGCYSIQVMSEREKCLNDASDSAAQKLLARMSPEERAQIFAQASGAAGASGAIPNGSAALPAGVNATPTYGQAVPGQSGQISESDSRAYAQAVSNTDMAPCVSISDASTRASCITQVALRVKNPSVCGNLTLQADIDICNLYAKGGEQAK